MIYVLGGLGLAIVYTSAALGIAIWQHDLQWFGDIMLSCRVTLTPAGECRADAIAAGWQTLTGLLLAAVILLATLYLEKGTSRRRWALPPRTFERSIPLRLFLLSVAILLTVHIITRLYAPLQVDRLAMLAQEGSFASLENLCWPLLLQLYVADRSRVGRYLALALLLATAALSFYRAMLLAVLVFGVGLYTLEIIWRMLAKHRHWRRYLPLLFERTLIGLLVAVVFLAAAKGDSDSRKTFVASIEASDTEASDTEASDTQPSPISIGERKILQRIAYPIYQASLAQRMAETAQLPTIEDGLARKLRLSQNPNLNEYLYRIIYHHPMGQTTSLTYGEAAAWSSAPPLIWIAAVTLPFLVIALIGRCAAIPIGLLVGLAIWRGFNGGTIDILPSFVIQLIAVSLIARLQLRHGESR